MKKEDPSFDYFKRVEGVDRGEVVVPSSPTEVDVSVATMTTLDQAIIHSVQNTAGTDTYGYTSYLISYISYLS